MSTLQRFLRTLVFQRSAWFATFLSFLVVRASLIIPAYNEEGRLPAFLNELVAFRETHPNLVDEVLVVDDGSTDRTREVATAFAGRLPLRLIRLPQNRGKGAAVQRGIQEALGEYIVFMDADGATPADELPKILTALENSPIVVGNRWMRGSSVAGRERFRQLSGWIYRTYVGFFGLRGIDTMCGFKGFRADTARQLFWKLLTERWLFDTEVMLRARRRGYPIARVPIAWTSKHGSKLKPSVLARSVIDIPILAMRVWKERSDAPAPT